MEEKAIARQRALCDRLHAAGAEVLMSSHFYRFLSCEEVLEIAKQQAQRGADVIKIVSWTDSRKQLAENLKTTLLLKEQSYPFMFASNGPWCVPHRSLAPFLGETLVLCTQSRSVGASPVQPLLKSQKTAMNHLMWDEVSFSQESADAKDYQY